MIRAGLTRCARRVREAGLARAGRRGGPVRRCAVPASRGPQAAGPDRSMNSRPRELPNLRFADGHGTPTSLAAFQRRLVLFNVWATWCPPCPEEMPSLDRLRFGL